MCYMANYALLMLRVCIYGTNVSVMCVHIWYSLMYR